MLDENILSENYLSQKMGKDLKDLKKYIIIMKNKEMFDNDNVLKTYYKEKSIYEDIDIQKYKNISSLLISFFTNNSLTILSKGLEIDTQTKECTINSRRINFCKYLGVIPVVFLCDFFEIERIEPHTLLILFLVYVFLLEIILNRTIKPIYYWFHPAKNLKID